MKAFVKRNMLRSVWHFQGVYNTLTIAELMEKGYLTPGNIHLLGKDYKTNCYRGMILSNSMKKAPFHLRFVQDGCSILAEGNKSKDACSDKEPIRWVMGDFQY